MAVDCCAFKTHSVLGTLPRKFISHFPSSHMDCAPPRRKNKNFPPESGNSNSSLNTGSLSLTKEPCFHCCEPPRRLVTASLSSEKRGMIYTQCDSFQVLHYLHHGMVWVHCAFAFDNSVFSGIDLLTFEQCVRRLIELCCVWFKGSAAMWEALSFENKASFHKSIIPLTSQASSMWFFWCWS